MRQGLLYQNDLDADGNPAGGYCEGPGLRIDWQNGPLARGLDRLPSNGAFLESVIEAAVHRLEFYQGTRFACRENAAALIHLREALHHLHVRTAEREERGVEGTHTI